MANYILDFQISNSQPNKKVVEKEYSYSSYEEEEEEEEYDDSDLRNVLSFDLLISVISFCFNEEIIWKIIKITNFFDDNVDEKIGEFIDELEKVDSSRMTMSLFDKIMAVLPKDILLKMTEVLEMKKHLVVANYIKSKLDTK